MNQFVDEGNMSMHRGGDRSARRRGREVCMCVFVCSWCVFVVCVIVCSWSVCLCVRACGCECMYMRQNREREVRMRIGDSARIRVCINGIGEL
jgi:Flp pilus assembly protein TadB